MRAFLLSLALASTVCLAGCEADDADAVEAGAEAVEDEVDATTDAIQDVDPTPFEGDTATVVDDDVMDAPLVDPDPDTTGL